MQIRILVINLVLFVGQVYQQSLNGNSSKNDYVFDLADLSLDFNTNNGSVHLEAFKQEDNNGIIMNKLKENYGQLKWVSIGNPQIILNKSNDSSKDQIFKMRPEGFSINVETLTDENRTRFTELIYETYNVNVKPRQNLSLVPTKFDCKIVFKWKR